VTRRFGRRVVLQPTDLQVETGEVVALGGPNGAGKSTLLAILAGALRPSGGSVAVASQIGWMPQRPALYGRLTPRENLELFARLAGLDDPRAAVARALSEVGLDVEERRAAELSVGNQQRLNLAIGLLGEPSVLLLDEPTASLDARRRGALWELVARVRSAGGGVLFATHNLDEARRVADRLLVLEEGVLVYQGPPAGYREEQV
jgi:ABC-type multidrug transport system ATPase subunit